MRHGSGDKDDGFIDRPIVAFDFDGTLSVRDSFIAFLRWRVPYTRWASGLVRMAPAILAYVLDRDRERMKGAAVAEFLKGLPSQALEAEGEAFAAHVWPTFIRSDALKTWNDWGEQGAWRVIVTASPETTIAPFARRLGADQLIGTKLALDSDGRVAGGFATPNCRSAQKVVRLREAFGPEIRLAAAYGDSSGDTEMLKLAEVRGMKVFKARG